MEQLYTQIRGMLPEDYVPPELKLVQRTTSGVKAQPGQFWHVLRQEAKDAVVAVVLRFTETRTRWGRNEISGEPPECASDDAASFKSRTGLNCLDCPDRCDNPWDYPQEERRSLCLKGFALLCIDLDEREPFVMRLSGLSALSMREFATNLRFRQLKGHSTPVKVFLKGEKKTTKFGDAYFCRPTIMGPLAEEETAVLLALAADLLALPAGPEAQQSEVKAEAPQKVSAMDLGNLDF